MGETLKRILTHNMGLKIISLVSAAVFWLIVVSIEDPMQTRVFTTTVDVANEELLDAQDKYYIIPDGKNTISCRVTGRRSVIEKLNGSNFTAVADMANLEDDSRIPVEVSLNRYYGEVSILPGDYYLNVEVGQKMSTKFIITPKTKGKPAEGFAIDTVQVEPNSIKVSGPKQIVSSIDSVEAVIDVSGLSGDISEDVIPTFYDKKGHEMDTTQLTKGADKQVTVTATMDMKKDVSIIVGASGSPPEGARLTELSTTPKMLAIQGPANLLNYISNIEIPNSVVNLDGMMEDQDVEVDISEYLEEGVTLVTEKQSKVTIHVDMSRKVTKKFKIHTENLKIENQEDKMVTFREKTVKVAITGYEDDLGDLEADEITGYVDVSGLPEGEHSVSVNLELDDKYSAQTASTKIFVK